MVKITVVGIVLFGLTALMTMTGRGGGNFYVLTLVLAGFPMHEAATSGQFILFTTALTASLIFHKHRALSAPLALFIGLPTAGMAFAGGFLAHFLAGVTLKVLFSFLLIIAGLVMLYPAKVQTGRRKRGVGYWHLDAGDGVYVINVWLVLPIAVATGFCAGMVGVSGGSFLVPLMVLGCGVPMRVAVGTATAMVAATAFAGFMGHAFQGGFDPSWAVPLAAITMVGGMLGGKIAMKTKPTHLKTLFAATTLAAAIFLALNAVVTG